LETPEMVERVGRARRRFKQELPLKARLQQAARARRKAAEAAQSPIEREALLRAARRYEVTAKLDEWLSSPGLLPPV
jgi:hypothetical protein